VKATFSVTLIVPAHLTALSNMPEISSTHVPAPAAHHGTNGGRQLKKVVFDVSPKMSTYLLAWAVGEFDCVQGVTKNGVTIRVLSPPGRGPQGRFALDAGIRSLDFYDQYFKVSLSGLLRLMVALLGVRSCTLSTPAITPVPATILPSPFPASPPPGALPAA
jgi:aminopeptidase N